MQNLKEIFNISKLRPILWSDSPLVFSGRVTSLTLKLVTCDFEGKRALTFIINNIASYVFLGVSFYIALALNLALHIILIIPLLVKDIKDIIAPDLAKGAKAKLPLLSKLNLKKICHVVIFTIISLFSYIYMVCIFSDLKNRRMDSEYKDYTHGNYGIYDFYESFYDRSPERERNYYTAIGLDLLCN